MGTTTAEPTSTGSKPTTSKADVDRYTFRGDVDGLRAIAIVVVVLFHTGYSRLHGGFIGVDVFFVISGFLISRRLLREAERTDRISLPTFWARRIRRLVPALGLVVAVTLVAAFVIMPIFSRPDLARQGGAAALYVSNILFAVQSQNYFAANVNSSPFVHTWSLGVEEQFYLVWPVLFALVCGAAGRGMRGRSAESRRRTLVALFGAIFVVSLAYNVWLTRSGSTWAFFGLPTRAWEFAVAGLLAAVHLPRALRRVGGRTALAVAGLVVLALGLRLIGAKTPYPGLWALLPVSAAVLLIMAGDTWGGSVRATPVNRFLALGPMQWLGRVSYSWYLWHWPAIVLAAAALHSNSVRVKGVAALLSLPVAWLAYKFFETPIRFAPVLTRSNRRTYGFGLALTAVVLVAALVVNSRTPTIRSLNAEAVLAVEYTQGEPGASLQERVNFVVTQFRNQVEVQCPKNSVESPDGDAYCIGGDTASPVSLMLIGDSHAGQWRPSFNEVAKQMHVKLLIRQHSGCPPYGVHVNTGFVGRDTLCQEATSGDTRLIKLLRPRAVVLASWSGEVAGFVDEQGKEVPPKLQPTIWIQKLDTYLKTFGDTDTKVGMILDEPTLRDDASECIATKNSVAECEPTRSSAMYTPDHVVALERKYSQDHGLPHIDTVESICDAKKCSLEKDGVLVYVDNNHLTNAFVAKLIPQIQTLFNQLLH